MSLNLPGDWQLGLEAARAIFLLADILLIFGAAYFLRRGLKMRPPFTLRAAVAERHGMLKNDAKLREAWAAVKAKAGTNPPSSYILTIIEADTFVDDVLKRLGLAGETMMDRLNQLKETEFPQLENVRRAHRIRNALVHRPGFSITPDQASEMLETYENFLNELELV